MQDRLAEAFFGLGIQEDARNGEECFSVAKELLGYGLSVPFISRLRPKTKITNV
jgi:hypothetical protein